LRQATEERGGGCGGDLAGLGEKIAGLDGEIRAAARQDDEGRRLMTVPGIGPITAMAVQAFAPPRETFRRARDFAAWLGKISKRGQRDLRWVAECRHHGGRSLGGPAGRTIHGLPTGWRASSGR